MDDSIPSSEPEISTEAPATEEVQSTPPEETITNEPSESTPRTPITEVPSVSVSVETQGQVEESKTVPNAVHDDKLDDRAFRFSTSEFSKNQNSVTAAFALLEVEESGIEKKHKRTPKKDTISLEPTPEVDNIKVGVVQFNVEPFEATKVEDIEVQDDLPPLPKIISLPEEIDHDEIQTYLTLIVGDAVKVEEEGDVRTEYTVMVETNLSEFGTHNQNFLVKRRYNQFRKLYDQIVRETGPKGLPKFPSKTILSRFRQNIIKERKMQFQMLLNFIAEDEQLRTSLPLFNFLGLHTV